MKPLRAAFAVLLAAAQTAAAGPAAISDAYCAPRADLVRQLGGLYGADPRGQGLRDPETVMELWSTPAGDWTLVMTYADGHACVVAMGEGWSALPPRERL